MRIAIWVLIFVVLALAGLLAYRHLHKEPVKTVVEDPYAKVGHLMRESEESVSRGLNFLRQGDAGKALFEFQDAIRLDSNNYRAYYNLGVLFRATGVFERAEGSYRTAIELAPRFYASWNNMANLMMMKNGPKDSALFYASVPVAAYPDCTDYVDTKIDALLFAGKAEDADALWKKAFKKDSSHVGLQRKKELFEALRRKQ